MKISGTIKRTTEKAILIAALVHCHVQGGMEVDMWFPKSQLTEINEDSIEAKNWIVSKKEEEYLNDKSRTFI